MTDQPKPVLRDEAFFEMESVMRNMLAKILKDADKPQVFSLSKDFFPYRTCLNCQHFNEPEEKCMWWKARPPARTIVYGCKDYDDKDGIPF